MKTAAILLAWLLGVMCAGGADTKREEFFLSLLHKLQYVESYQDLKALIPDCPPPKSDAGEDNTEVIIKTNLFGFEAEGEFNFHNNVLVSHGMKIKTATYKDAHNVFLRATRLLDEQIDGLHLEASLPFGLDGEDGSDGWQDQIYVTLRGEHLNASYALSLKLREEVVGVGWGAQKKESSCPAG